MRIVEATEPQSNLYLVRAYKKSSSNLEAKMDVSSHHPQIRLGRYVRTSVGQSKHYGGYTAV
jgi:hypothetical protein